MGIPGRVHVTLFLAFLKCLAFIRARAWFAVTELLGDARFQHFVHHNDGECTIVVHFLGTLTA